jgi:hypothetical protein
MATFRFFCLKQQSCVHITKTEDNQTICMIFLNLLAKSHNEQKWRTKSDKWKGITVETSVHCKTKIKWWQNNCTAKTNDQLILVGRNYQYKRLIKLCWRIPHITKLSFVAIRFLKNLYTKIKTFLIKGNEEENEETLAFLN